MVAGDNLQNVIRNDKIEYTYTGLKNISPFLLLFLR